MKRVTSEGGIPIKKKRFEDINPNLFFKQNEDTQIIKQVVDFDSTDNKNNQGIFLIRKKIHFENSTSMSSTSLL